ncbi:MAG: type II toxin-antitoxin system HicB family antitoxin [Deltaproteobacteria bacterium]|nr:MAG: type II toxin-antitoxin system HicB family antitoxin [Deltaproteobacteria bacterium]
MPEDTTSIQSSERSLFGRSSSARLHDVKLRYVVTIERESDGRFIASVPEVPGCHVYGRTRRQAVERARRALQFYVGRRLSGGSAPGASCPSRPRRTCEGPFPRDPPTWKSSVPDASRRPDDALRRA